MEFFDTHAHLDDEQFEGIREDVVARAQAAGVQTILAVAVSAASSAAVVDLASRHSEVFASVGVQPNYCAEADPADWDRIAALVRHPRVVALGETGLDRYWDRTPFLLQQDYFDRHLRLAQQVSLPVVIHMRDCGADMLAMLQEARRRGPLEGVMHSFTGDAELARACWELGLSISFAGMVTYKKSDALRATAAAVPDERLLLETDSPYLSPHPHRGARPNEPALVVHTAACLAEVRGVPLERLAAITTDNARRLFLAGRSSSQGPGAPW